MRIYVASASDGYRACAPEIPGSGATGHELRPTREEAIAQAREFAAAELAAYARLGIPLRIDPGEQVIEWSASIWLIPELLIPIRPRELRGAVSRMDELVAELERVSERLTPAQRDACAGSEWSAGMILDHVAQGFPIGVTNLEPCPLDPTDAQAAALRGLVDALRAVVGTTFSATHFGVNPENRRVRWTPRKVARAARTFQDAFARYLAEGGLQPRAWDGHDDHADDDLALTTADVAELEKRGRDLLADDAARTTPVAYWYRYYRTRLVRWPEDALTRLRAMYATFRELLLSADEADIARVRLLPTGMAPTIRSELRLGIGHVVGHLAQLRAAAAVSA